MTILRAPIAFLTALINGVTNTPIALADLQAINPNADNPPGLTRSNGGLRLVLATTPSQDPRFASPAEYVGSSANIAAQINAGARTIALPGGYTGAYLLEIPSRWLPTLANLTGFPTFASQMPTSGPLQLTTECAADFQGMFAAAFQGIGFTSFSPSLTTPIPVVGAWEGTAMSDFHSLDQPFAALNAGERDLAKALGSQLAGHPVDERTGHELVTRDRARRRMNAESALRFAKAVRDTVPAARRVVAFPSRLAKSRPQMCPKCGRRYHGLCSFDPPPRAA